MYKIEKSIPIENRGKRGGERRLFLNSLNIGDSFLVNYKNMQLCRTLFGHLKPKFIQRAFEERKKGKTCVLLIPSATGTKQFHEIILPNAEVRFIKGRVSFCGYNTKGIRTEKNKGKHDSMIVIFKH